MISDPPSLDNRTFDDILRQIEELARSYLNNQWISANSINGLRNNRLNNIPSANVSSNQDIADMNLDNLQDDVGIALSKVFASFYMNILSRLNKLPRKNLIEFLNVMGFNLSSPIASRVPVTFKPADGAKDDVFVPSGTIVASDANDKHDELMFETEQNMQVTRANIAQFYTVNNKIDAIYSHIENLRINEDFKLFYDDNGSIQEHILYLGHQDLFNLKNTSAKIFLTIITDEKNIFADNLLVDKNNVVWEYNWKYDDKGKEIRNSATEFTVDVKNDALNDDNDSVNDDERKRKKTTVVLSNKNSPEKKIEKSKVNEIENYWIRCRFQPSEDNWNFTKIGTDRIPTIEKIRVKVELDTEKPLDGRGSSPSPAGIPSSSIPPESTRNSDTNAATKGGFIIPDLLFYKDTPIQVPTEDNKKSDNERTENEGDNEDEAEKFVYPFGKQPSTFDIFYIASNDCFSKKNTIITLKFFEMGPNFKGKETVDETHGEKNEEPIISWEYWNGKGWNGLFILNHKGEEKADELNFLCPGDIEIFSVNGNDNYWIRARLVSGDYGKGKLIQETGGTLTITETKTEEINKKTVTWDPGISKWDYSDIKAPKFKLLKIKFTDIDSFKSKNNQVELPSRAIDSQTLEMASQPMCITYNNLEYKDISNSNNEAKPKVFKQFLDQADPSVQNDSSAPSLSSSAYYYIYLGFDKKIEGGPILIYVSIVEERNYDDVGEQLKFYYYSPTGWKKLYVDDGTNYFSRKGYIKLFLPSDFQSYSLFGNSMYWIRIEDSGKFYEREPFRIPTVQSFILNTVSCINAYAIEDEVLSKDERTSYENKFVFSKKPLTLIENKREQIWVKEKLSPSDKEWSFLSKDNRIRTVNDAVGNLLETWVLWKEFGYQNNVTDRVSHLSSSQNNSRIYDIDRIEGRLYLGLANDNSLGGAQSLLNTAEGIPALIKQIGVDSLVKANYIVGGGSQGNVNVEEVKTLKSLIPFIDSVTNNDKGKGGSDTQSVQNAIETMPSFIKNRGQAVTAEDFESLIISNFASLSRVKCFPTTDSRGNIRAGHILVVAIPKIESTGHNKGKDDKASHTDIKGISLKEEMPYPSIVLLRNIKQYVDSKASDTVISTEKLHITGPSYFRVFVSANLYVTAIDDLPIAEKKALDLIKKFLDAFEGGKDGKGWEFGKILSISDVYSLLSSVDEVKYIDNVLVRIELDEYNVIKLENSNNDTLKKEYILSETNNDIDAITSILLPHSLLCDGSAHNLTMRISNYK
jgi:hypothetical protein